MLNVVLDTNVIVSAFLSKNGVPNQILRQAGIDYQLFIAFEILEESRRVLNRPKIQKRGRLTKDEILQFLNDLCAIADIVKNLPSLQVIEDDPSDNVILACALEAKADYLVSGDIHLQKLKIYKEIRIISPSDFLCILKRCLI